MQMRWVPSDLPGVLYDLMLIRWRLRSQLQLPAMGNLDFNDWTKVRVGQIFNFGSGVLENTRRRKGSNEMDFGSWARKPTWESRVGTFALLSQLHIAEM